LHTAYWQNFYTGTILSTVHTVSLPNKFLPLFSLFFAFSFFSPFSPFSPSFSILFPIPSVKPSTNERIDGHDLWMVAQFIAIRVYR
jgi:hypothetical protein